MEFFLDTANIEEIKKAQQQGLVDGVTTNPTLLAREKTDWRHQAQTICELISGPVSLEVIATTATEMINEARELIQFGSNVVIKLPMTPDGLVATKSLATEGIKTNVTLVFTAMQALLAAKAGATYVSPFVGRLDGLSQNGMELVEQIRVIYDNYAFTTKILVASIRHPLHVQESALIGADVATIPFAVLNQLSKHPLTDQGLAQFLNDWKAFTA